MRDYRYERILIDRPRLRVVIYESRSRLKFAAKISAFGHKLNLTVSKK